MKVRADGGSSVFLFLGRIGAETIAFERTRTPYYSETQHVYCAVLCTDRRARDGRTREDERKSGASST